MNWLHLMYFKKVAERKILTKAAEELFATPSTLSKAIASLEEELGVDLFEKQGRNIVLNRYGRIFYEYVCNAHKEIDDGINTIRRIADVRNGSVRVSSIFSVGTNFIPDLLAYFYEEPENKQIKIELSQRTTAQIIEDIKNGDLDIAFCGEFIHMKQFSEISYEPIYDEKVMLIVPQHHRLALQKTVTFEDIKDEEFIGYNNSTGIVQAIHEAVTRKGYPNFEFKNFVESNEDNNTTNLVKRGLGIAFVVDNPSIYSDEVKVLDVTDLNIICTIYMVWNRNTHLTPAVDCFRNTILMYKENIRNKQKTNSVIKNTT